MTIAEIKKKMTDAFISDAVVVAKYGLQPDKTFEEQFKIDSVENIFFFIVAYPIWWAYQLFDKHKSDVAQILREQTPGTAGWYAWKAKQFQFGMALVTETDYYDNSELTDEQIEAIKVVKYAASVESLDKSILYLKVAGGSDTRTQITAPQLTAFKAYMNEVQYAGVRLSVINDPADKMNLVIDIYYDPEILDETGRRLDGTAENPVRNAIENYLNNLPFNAMFTKQALIDSLQAVSGVDVAEIQSAASRYGAYQNFTEINAREIAHAGYYEINELTLNFIPDEEIL
jgi:hypothetical protein